MIVVEGLVQQQGGDTRILVREAVVILTPHVRGDQQVHGGDRLAPWDLAHGGLKPLCVLVQHGVDHVHEGLVGAPDTVATGEGHVLVDLSGQITCGPLLVGHIVCSLQTVGCGLIRSEDTEGIRVQLDDVASVGTQSASGFELSPAVAVLSNFLDLVVFELRQVQLFADTTTVGVRVLADTQFAFRHELGHIGLDCSVGIEQLFRLVGFQPVLEDFEMSLGIASGSQRHLVGTP